MPNYMIHACIDCGVIRLVQTVYGKSRSPRCRSCSKKGENHPLYGILGQDAAHWKGGQHIDNKGYVWVYSPNHPFADDSNYVKRSRLVLEDKLGRYLNDGCDVHHINGIKGDDCPENLEELSHSNHTSLHSTERNYKRYLETTQPRA